MAIRPPCNVSFWVIADICASPGSWCLDRGRQARGRASGSQPYLPAADCVSSAARVPTSALPARGSLRDTAEMTARASEVFAGRAGELGELRRALDAARAGAGATV